MTHLDQSRRALGVLPIALAALLLFAPSAHAQVYKWVDEHGIVNYGNEPPAAKGRSARPVRLEDNLSVYTPDEGVLEATKRARERSAQRVPDTVIAQPPPPARSNAPGVTTAPPLRADAPCVSGFEPNCQRATIIEGTVIQGAPRRAPRLNQPELPSGAIAGNINAGAGATPGLSTQVQTNAKGERITPSASFTLKEIDERERARR